MIEAPSETHMQKQHKLINYTFSLGNALCKDLFTPVFVIFV